MEEIITKDISDMDTRDVNAGEDGLNLFVVAPARINHEYDGALDLKDNNCYVMEDDALHSAKRYTRANKQDYCVYKLITLARYNYKG